MRDQLRPALLLFLALSLITGIVYPFVTTGIASVLFPVQAHGSLIRHDGATIGSRLIGQSFSDSRYFWGRPSASGSWSYNAAASGGSNLGPLNPALVDAVKSRAEALRAAHPEQTGTVPADLVTSSASGLDPDISPAAARYQVTRVARARGLAESAVLDLVQRHTQGRQLGFLGEPRVSVLALNLALDGREP